MPIDWLSNDHIGTPTDMNAAMVQQQWNSVFCVARANSYKQDEV
jgi:hypothetical protein